MAEEMDKKNKLTNDDVSNILNEIVSPDEIDVEHLNKKDVLCPDIWDSEDKMNPEVRKILLKNAHAFISYLNIDDLNFKDITLTGSLANYNWTEQSDLDVHVLCDLTQISDDTEFVSDYFKSKKQLWSNVIPVTVKDHEVELYIQDTNEPHASTGVYSIIKDTWITKPIKTMIAIDTENVRIKASEIMNQIDELEQMDDMEVIDCTSKIMEKLKKMRTSGLEDAGEFSTENLVFKTLRNNGYLEKMLDIKNNSLKSELTLEGIEINEGLLDEGNLINFVRKAKNAGILTLGVVVGLLAGNVSRDAALKSGIPQELIIKAERYLKSGFNDDLMSNDNINNDGNEIHNSQKPVK